ncbi:hypothetical protein AB0B52_15185 [Streptomyces griseofuscus]|uniref:hypothetical protein n=1 Tax=Streptomyces griseofuscus TaxID=146922 RepID=UPI0033CD2F28
MSRRLSRRIPFSCRGTDSPRTAARRAATLAASIALLGGGSVGMSTVSTPASGVHETGTHLY